jgi:fructokinase
VSFKVVGLGEALWDLLPGNRQVGGSPANFACHAAALGAEAGIVSRVGRDDLGRELIERLDRLGVRTAAIETDPSLPTGSVRVELASGGQPQFFIEENVAWDALHGEAAGREAVSAADAVCFGSMGQRSEPARTSIRALLAATRAEAWRIFDINLRQHYYSGGVLHDSLSLANALKVSDAELPRLAELLGLRGDARAQIVELASRYKLRCVAYTRGEKGSLLFVEGRWSDHPGHKIRVADTVGAGDAFTAAMTLGLLAGWPLDEVNSRAGEVAAFVCSQSGATPPLPESMRARFHRALRA